MMGCYSVLDSSIYSIYYDPDNICIFEEIVVKLNSDQDRKHTNKLTMPNLISMTHDVLLQLTIQGRMISQMSASNMPMRVWIGEDRGDSDEDVLNVLHTRVEDYVLSYYRLNHFPKG